MNRMPFLLSSRYPASPSQATAWGLGHRARVLLACITMAMAVLTLILSPRTAQAQQDTTGLGLRLNQSITSVTDLSAITSAQLVNMDYGSATSSLQMDTVTSAVNKTSDPRITAQTQSYGDGIYTIAQIEAAAKAALLPQQTTLISRIRTAAAAARVAGAVWVFNQTVRPLGSGSGASRPMKVTWYIILSPSGRVLTADPEVVEEDPTLVYLVYYSKAVGRSIPASYAWADAGMLKWQLRRYDGSPVTGWTTVYTSGAYDSPEGDSEAGPRCVATAPTVSGCAAGQPSARSLMDQTASRKAIIDYVRAVEVAFSETSAGLTPNIQIAFDVRLYTRISCTSGSYRCAGSIGYTVVETIDRYTMTDTQALPTKLNSTRGLNSSRPAASFDVSLGVSEKPSAVEPFVVSPFDTPLELVAKTDMPGVVRMATMQVQTPPTAGEYTCLNGGQVVGDRCVTTTSTAANVTYTCANSSPPNGSSCSSTTTTAATPTTTYACLNGGTRNGTTCTIASTSYPATPTTTYSCLNGGLLSGSTCTQPGSSYAATPTTTYSCLNGGTRSGSTCTVTTTYAPSTGNPSASASTGDTVVGSGTPGLITFGSIGDNYWGAGQYDRTMTVHIPNPASVSEFRLIRAQFDDWVSLRVNGTWIGTAPYPGDRLELVDQEVETCGETCFTYIVNKVRYGANEYGWPELGRSWDMAFDIDLRPYLVAGNNAIQVRTIVGGRGEMWLQFRASINTCQSGGSLVGGLCVSSTSYPATPTTTYSCLNGGLLSGSTCTQPGSSYAATPTTTYTCLNGGTRSGSTCAVAASTYSATPTTTYTCLNGGTLSGSSCVSTLTTAATPNYSCSAGILSGSSCIAQSTSAATWAPLICPD
ncbi:hypothetical protein [Limnohabitans radicicola]|uniref:Uncharacterized protein n=1 Tax=Limnohabitans radicicola TaxID=2771427 RepID=A0A927FI14_9BURK|nr:hypothetical protein [Limnohabitans radicicola]MBD8051086.1 hypothetical protein [Limnohabitans radicicola]